MLQTRLENEQFNSLPNIITHYRSQNSFITTDRPDSSQLVDLHIYIIPKSVWRNLQHLAQNEAMDDAISAGFVRVSPDMKLHSLRDSIERLCGTEIYFPRDFIFLRSVGRCLTRVKQTQENQLKVKNYRPPQTFAPEIYLLEGRHEDYGSTPSASPALSSASYLFGNRHQQRLNLENYDRSPTKLDRYTYRKPLHTEKNQKISRVPPPGKKSLTTLTQIGSDVDESTANMSLVTSIASRDLSKLREEQERLRRRQAELERMRRAAEGNERRRHREEKVQPERDEEERHRRRRQEKADAERRRLEQTEIAATKIQASFRGFKDRQAFRERQRNLLKPISRISSSKSNTTNKNKEKTDINDDDELSYGSPILSRSSSIGSTSDVDSNPSRPETRTIKKESRESIHSKSSLIKDDDDENARAATVTKMRHSDEEVLPVSTPDITEDDTYELERRQGEAKRRRQTEEERRKAKELEEQRRRQELARQQQHEDSESLRTRLQELRASHLALQRIRDEVIKQLKYMHNRITSRRKEARDMWKKKYFLEKKKTPTIEDNSTQLKTELDRLHEKIAQTIDNECKHAAQIGYSKEAEVGNFILQTTRIQHEIQDIRHQVDQAKLRLTTDIKLRNQSETECRTLKHELSQAKMNLKHMKNRLAV